MQNLIRTPSPFPLREYGIGLAAGTLPLVLALIWSFRMVSGVPTLSGGSVNVGFIFYPFVAIYAFGVEILATLCCLCLRRLRPLGAGGLTMLVLSLCLWPTVIYSWLILFVDFGIQALPRI